MAKVELKLPTDFEERLSRLADKTDEIIPKVLEAGGEVILAKVKSNLSSVVGRGTNRIKADGMGDWSPPRRQGHWPDADRHRLDPME